MNEETKEIKKCPKCGGGMEKGFTLDTAHHAWTKAKWAKSVGVGINIFGLGAKKAKTITSYRCENCGYLENYTQ